MSMMSARPSAQVPYVGFPVLSRQLLSNRCYCHCHVISQTLPWPSLRWLYAVYGIHWDLAWSHAVEPPQMMDSCMVTQAPRTIGRVLCLCVRNSFLYCLPRPSSLPKDVSLRSSGQKTSTNCNTWAIHFWSSPPVCTFSRCVDLQHDLRCEHQRML